MSEVTMILAFGPPPDTAIDWLFVIFVFFVTPAIALLIARDVLKRLVRLLFGRRGELEVKPITDLKSVPETKEDDHG